MARLRMENVGRVVRLHHGEFAATNLEGEILAFAPTPAEAAERARGQMPSDEEPILFRVPKTICAHLF